MLSALLCPALPLQMTRSAFTRENAALSKLIELEQTFVRGQVKSEPAGTGLWLSPWALQRNQQDCAPDLHELALRLADSDLISGGFKASASLWPIADNALAYVVLQHVLEFALEPEELLAEASRCLRGHAPIVIVGFRRISAANIARNWRATAPHLSSAGSWVRACRALGLADISVERMGVGWPWLDSSHAPSAWLTRALPNLASVYILTARKRGMRARLSTKRASVLDSRSRAAAFGAAGYRFDIADKNTPPHD